MKNGDIVVVTTQFKRNILPSDYLSRMLSEHFFWVNAGVDRKVSLPVGLKLKHVGLTSAQKGLERVPAAVFSIEAEQDNDAAQQLADDYAGWLMVLSESKQQGFLKFDS